MKDRFHLDYFDIIGVMKGEDAARSREEWNAIRQKAGKSITLEPLPGKND